jgi:hypothetical protein
VINLPLCILFFFFIFNKIHSKQSLEPHFKQLYKLLIFIVAYFEQFLVKDVSLQAGISFVTCDVLFAV